jgi:hypothetical protein
MSSETCGVFDQHLDRGEAAPRARLDEPLRDDREQVLRQVEQHLRVLQGRKHVDDAVERPRRIVGVQRRDRRGAGAGEREHRLHRLAIADLTDLDDVRRLSIALRRARL